ncbi:MULTISPECIES: holo-ACP synthase [unclassified Desulfurobacterium]|uniref:holo-ACP synthase n=1 Tax=unclassified Desulfurobacterium TaxID=2639089 RepID=UPI0003B2F2E4|nr:MULTISPECIES: 4'-phosphopantetheinyl transferase superfamily protein [unclassified Desulfurobacterium]
MIVSCGVDIVSNKRVEDALKRWGDRFVRKVFPEGVEYCFQKRRGEVVGCIAARFALKEAIIKAFSRINVPVRFEDIVVSGGGKHLDVKIPVKGYRILFSISHEKDFSVAFVNVIREEADE